MSERAKPVTLRDADTDEQETMNFEALLASSIHDMKNSLSMLIADLDATLERSKARDKGEHARYARLKYEGERIKNNLIHLLSTYRISNKHYYLNIDEHCVHDVMTEAVAAFDPLTESTPVQLTLQCDEDLEWFFDRSLVYGVINNILSNAFKYAKSKIHLAAFMQDKQLVIQVNDDGSGFPQNMIEYIDHCYSKIDFVTGATGLGLYFSWLAARMHKNKDKTGYIQISNEGINHGGRFSIVIP